MKLRNDDLKDEPLDTAADTEIEEMGDWSEKAVHQLLDLLMEFRDWFTDKDNAWDDSNIWETISEQMKLEGHQLSPDQSRRMWRFLTEEYQKNKAEAEASGTVPSWRFYTRVRRVMVQVGVPAPRKTASTGSTKRKPGRKRGRKKKINAETNQLPLGKAPDTDAVVDELNESDASHGRRSFPGGQEAFRRSTAGSVPRPRRGVEVGDIEEVCRRLDTIEENVAINRRLDSLEAELDCSAEVRRAQRQTNQLLTKVLGELASLRQTLSTQNTPNLARQDPTDLASGITIVVPQSQHL